MMDLLSTAGAVHLFKAERRARGYEEMPSQLFEAPAPRMPEKKRRRRWLGLF